MWSRRSLFAILVVLSVAGCPGTNMPINGQVMYTDAGCRIGCDKCGPNSFCVSAPYNVACLQKCTDTSQCPSGFLCALLNLHTLDTGCVSPDRPVWCSMEACTIQAKCRDANTLLRPLPFSDAVCGWEIVPCVSGCDATTAQCK